MLETIDDLSRCETTIDLKKSFPLPLRSIMRRAFWWVIGYLIICVFVFYGYYQIPAIPTTPVLFGFFESYTRWLLFFSTAVICCKLVYEIFYRYLYYYALEDGHLVISTGIFLKERGVYPITTITDVYLDRNFIDLLFGLYDIHTSNPSSQSHRYGDIQGLSTATAIRFQDYIRRLTEIVAPANEEAATIAPKDVQLDEKQKNA